MTVNIGSDRDLPAFDPAKVRRAAVGHAVLLKPLDGFRTALHDHAKFTVLSSRPADGGGVFEVGLQTQILEGTVDEIVAQFRDRLEAAAATADKLSVASKARTVGVHKGEHGDIEFVVL